MTTTLRTIGPTARRGGGQHRTRKGKTKPPQTRNNQSQRRHKRPNRNQPHALGSRRKHHLVLTGGPPLAGTSKVVSGNENQAWGVRGFSALGAVAPPERSFWRRRTLPRRRIFADPPRMRGYAKISRVSGYPKPILLNRTGRFSSRNIERSSYDGSR